MACIPNSIFSSDFPKNFKSFLFFSNIEATNIAFPALLKLVLVAPPT